MKVNHLYYWSEHFRNPPWETKHVPVRYDPFDVGTAYAFVDGQWIECHSEYYSVLHGHSEREVHLASEELRRRQAYHSGEFIFTAKKLAEFIESVEVEEGVLLQRLSDLEARSLQAQPVSSIETPDNTSDRCQKRASVTDPEPPPGPPVPLLIYAEF